MGALSIWHWLIVLLVVVLVFGTSKLRNMGKDLGSAVKGFKEAVGEGEKEAEQAKIVQKKSELDDTVVNEHAEKKDEHNA